MKCNFRLLRLVAASLLFASFTTTPLRAQDPRPQPDTETLPGDIADEPLTAQEIAVLVGDMDPVTAQEFAAFPAPAKRQVEGTMPVILSPELDAALSAIQTSPDAANIVDVLPKRFPHLAEQFNDYLLQFVEPAKEAGAQTATERVGQGRNVYPRTNPLTDADIGGCHCVFEAVSQPSPSDAISLNWHSRPIPTRVRLGWRGPEATQLVRQYRFPNGQYGGRTSLDSYQLESEMKGSVELKCRKLLAIQRIRILSFTIQFPIWGERCAMACKAELEMDGVSYLDSRVSLNRGLISGAKGEVMAHAFLGAHNSVTATELINHVVQISENIADVQFGINAIIPGFGQIGVSNNGVSWSPVPTSASLGLTVTWSSPGYATDGIANKVIAAPMPYRSDTDYIRGIFRTTSRSFVQGRGMSMATSMVASSYGMGIHAYASCARDTFYGHAALWGYDSHVGYGEEIRKYLNAFYSARSMALIP